MTRCLRAWCFVGAWMMPTFLGMESFAQEKTKKEARGALPPHVKEGITADQEKAARKIMDKYEEELDKLRDDVRHLELATTKARVEREKFIDKLLSADQKKQLKEFDVKAKVETDRSADDLRLVE